MIQDRVMLDLELNMHLHPIYLCASIFQIAERLVFYDMLSYDVITQM